MLLNLLLILAAVIVLSVITRSKNQKQMKTDRNNLQTGNLNDRQVMNIYRKLESYQDSQFYAMIAYGIFYKQYFKDAAENYSLFKDEMHKRDLFKTYLL